MKKTDVFGLSRLYHMFLPNLCFKLAAISALVVFVLLR
jgi:hypothetical protein